MRKYLFVITVAFLAFSNNISYAKSIEPKPLASDPRFKIYVYKPNVVYKYTGYYGFQSSIKFGDDEAIETISLGDSTAWMISPAVNRIFIKPVEKFATTNMTIMTNKRIYHFELEAKNNKDIDNSDLTFIAEFKYPDSENNIRTVSSGKKYLPDLNKPEKYNFRYSVSGPESISPIKVFDDGEFTYFQFKEINTEIPAIFLVDSDGYEGLINFRVDGGYVIVERVHDMFSLRHGNDVSCIFNEAMPRITK